MDIDCEISGWAMPNHVHENRDPFWNDRGYDLAWEETPQLSDVGKTAAQYFVGPDWDILSDRGRTTIVELEGKATMRSFLPATEPSGFNLNVKGFQLSPTNTDKDAVFSRVVYWPCGYGQIGMPSYIGTGHDWGSAAGITQFPSGSNNRPDGWSIRIPIATTSGQYYIYYYPGRPASSTQPGASGGASGVLPVCGQYALIETEVIQNVPASASNGTINLYVNGMLISSVNNLQLRLQDDVFPKGSGIFHQHNGGAPQDEILYMCDWKIYTRP